MIDSARILDSPFDYSVVFLSGADLELLRNLTQYLHRQDTFVATYFDNHYLTPDVDDWDAVQAIVANLEDKLMANENLIFGYNEVLAERHHENSDVNDDFSVDGDQVPEGEIWHVTGMSLARTSEASARIIPAAYINETNIALGDVTPAADYVFYPVYLDLILTEEDRITVTFESAVIGENCRVHYWGYKMLVS